MSEFERWQGRYAVAEYVFGESPNAFLAAQADLLPKSGTALAVADGEGRNGVFLAQCGLDTLSVDFAPAGQAKALALAQKRGVILRAEIADIHDWRWPPEAYDVVVDIFTQFSNPADRAQKWAGMARTLKMGGLLLVEGYTPKQLEYATGGPKQIENLYTREMLEEAFGHFAKMEIRQYDTRMNEGNGHSGMAAVIDLVAVK